jgi:hypothetical protein
VLNEAEYLYQQTNLGLDQSSVIYCVTLGRFLNLSEIQCSSVLFLMVSIIHVAIILLYIEA